MGTTPPADRREFFTLVARLPVAIFRTALDGRIMMANQAFADMLGYGSVSELQRMDAAVLYADPAQRAVIVELFEKGIMPPINELQLRRKDGSTLWTEVRSHLIGDGDEPRFIEGVVMDITEHKLAEDMVRASEERFRKVFENSPIGMSLRGLDGKPEAVNAALCTMLSMTGEEMLALSLDQLLHPEDAVRAEAAVQDLLADRIGEVRTEWRMRTSDGETSTVLAHLTKLSMPPAGPRILAQLVDVTDRRAILDNLERLVRSKDRLVRSVSHELRTPLTAVVGFAEELEDRTDIGVDERRDLLGVIAQQSREMADLIEDLLAAATADGGTLSVRPVVMDVVAVCRDVIAAWRGPAPDLEVDASPGPAHADPFRVRQILRNLLTNAERYGEAPIDLVVANGSTTVRLQVRDRGPGLPADAWESIFEPYQRAHEENQHGGVGLGLSVSRQLARAMHGDLAYRVEDGLSVFELSLPAAP